MANYLYHAANCEVYIDELELRRQPTVLPSDWLIRRVNDAEYYLMVFTEGSTIYFKQPRRYFLLNDRPWDELFGLGMKLVLGRLLRDTRQSTAPVSSLTLQRRYICIQLPYSSAAAIPDFLLTLQCPCFNLPDDLLALVCFLHHLNKATIAPNVPLHAERFIESLNATTKYISDNRDYLAQRLAPIDINSTELRDLSTITANLRLLSSFDTDGVDDTEAEQRQLIAVELNNYKNHREFPLITNDEDDQNEATPAFPLLPLDENE